MEGGTPYVILIAPEHEAGQDNNDTQSQGMVALKISLSMPN